MFVTIIKIVNVLYFLALILFSSEANCNQLIIDNISSKLTIAANEDEDDEDEEEEAVDYRDQVRDVKEWIHRRNTERKGDGPSLSYSTQTLTTQNDQHYKLKSDFKHDGYRKHWNRKNHKHKTSRISLRRYRLLNHVRFHRYSHHRGKITQTRYLKKREQYQKIDKKNNGRANSHYTKRVSYRIISGKKWKKNVHRSYLLRRNTNKSLNYRTYRPRNTKMEKQYFKHVHSKPGATKMIKRKAASKKY